MCFSLVIANPSVLFHHNFLLPILPIFVVPGFQRTNLVSHYITQNLLENYIQTSLNLQKYQRRRQAWEKNGCIYLTFETNLTETLPRISCMQIWLGHSLKLPYSGKQTAWELFTSIPPHPKIYFKLKKDHNRLINGIFSVTVYNFLQSFNKSFNTPVIEISWS